MKKGNAKLVVHIDSFSYYNFDVLTNYNKFTHIHIKMDIDRTKNDII